MSDYLTAVEIVTIHARLIERYGGAPGIREPGALEAAVMRPQLGYYEDPIQEAAALMESLAMNHPFIDGNKRIAFAAGYTFLRLNGIVLDCDPIAAHTQWMDLFNTGRFRFEHLEPWLRKHTTGSGPESLPD